MPKSKCNIWHFTCYLPKFIIEICRFLMWYAPIGLCYGQSYIQHVLIQCCLINLHMLNVWIFMDAYLKTYMYVWYARIHLRPLVIVTVELHVSLHGFSLDPTFMTYLGTKNTWDWILRMTLVAKGPCTTVAHSLLRWAFTPTGVSLSLNKGAWFPLFISRNILHNMQRLNLLITQPTGCINRWQRVLQVFTIFPMLWMNWSISHVTETYHTWIQTRKM